MPSGARVVIQWSRAPTGARERPFRGGIVGEIGSAASQHLEPAQFREGDAAVVRHRLDLTHAVTELLSIVAYINADDGPLQALPGSAGGLSPWQRPLLLKAAERLDVIDAHLRGRVAFLVAGNDHGYHTFEWELELAGAALDTCRASTSVVQALLAERPPTEREFETMSTTALRVYPALAAMRDGAPSSTSAP